MIQKITMKIPSCETNNCNLMDPTQGALEHDAILEVSDLKEHFFQYLCHMANITGS